MESIIKHIYLLTFISFMCIDVYGQDFNLAIRQEPRRAPGEWDVTLENTSHRVILDTYLDCKGFLSNC
ncbi:hypothetical protein HanXRQr2_Chr12g0545881 [Helianthus annuus]|uniref:Cupredoxin n=1 Tax=Helianthus annuus TaxID=4232 RepID=A0A251T3E1_HELAN|nr:hypothetical protein HanXRQr2_Chr12g0545881 [Helianthus annuus]KAJ0863053.1 hypothetical protein HanPSC8_Chr12g0525491 [Helianthus annuus]